jgi:hypothetical protein
MTGETALFGWKSGGLKRIYRQGRLGQSRWTLYAGLRLLALGAFKG